MKKLIATFTLGAALYAQQPPQYVIEDLGPARGYLFGINASGQVTGAMTASGEDRATRWTGTTPEVLGTLAGDLASTSHGINAAGQVVGNSNLFTGQLGRAVRWTGTTPQELSNLGLGGACTPFGINDSGQAAGTCAVSTLNGDGVPVRWTGTTPERLGLLGTETIHSHVQNEARAINSSGQVAGTLSLSLGTLGDSNARRFFPTMRAVRWTGTTPTTFGTLGGPNSQASAINDAGHVAGRSDTPTSVPHYLDRPFHAAIWTGTTPVDLGLLPGDFQSAAEGINSAGWAVGYSTRGTQAERVANRRAFVWNGVSMYNLNNFLVNGAGWVLRGATAINDAGQIAGYGSFNGQDRAFRLTPQTSVTITFATSPTGLLVNHGTGNVIAPALAALAPLQNVTISTPSPQAGPATGTQYAFANWSDGGAQSHSITVPAAATTYTANFTTQYRLTTLVNPPGAGAVSPPSDFYNAGTVAVSATPNGCNGFLNWTGATVSSGTINLAAPAALTANFAQNQAVAVSIGSLITLRNPVRFRRTVAVTNTLGYATSVSIILNGFGGGTTLVSPTAPSGQTTSCAQPAGRNYYTFLNVPPGGTVSQPFDFTAPSASMVSISVSAIAGPAPR